MRIAKQIDTDPVVQKLDLSFFLQHILLSSTNFMPNEILLIQKKSKRKNFLFAEHSHSCFPVLFYCFLFKFLGFCFCFFCLQYFILRVAVA